MAIQHTTCISANQIHPVWQHILAGAFLSSAIGAGIGGVIAAIVGAPVLPVVGAVALIVAPLGGFVGFCDWFFNWRLVCIADGEIVVGTINRTDVWFDGDYSVDMILAPCVPGCTLPELQAGPQGRFMQNQFPSLNFEPEKAGPPAAGTPIMHNEIEGDRLFAVYNAGAGLGIVGAAAGIVVFAAGATGSRWVGDGLLLYTLLGLLIAAFAIGLGVVIGYLIGGEGTPRQAGEKRSIGANDCVAVRGQWIYDSGHQGWNEIHAIVRVIKLDPTECIQIAQERITKIRDRLHEADEIETRRAELLQDHNRFLTHRAIG